MSVLTNEAGEEELTRFSNPYGDLSAGPAKFREDLLYCLLLITLLLNCNNDTLLINKHGSLVQELQLIQALAMNEAAQEETLLIPWR